MLWAYTVIYATSSLSKGVRLFKAQIVSDNIKEFIGTIAPIVDETKMRISPTGITIKAVDPSHVAMIESTLASGAFTNLEAEEAELGVDVTKFKSVINVAKPGEIIDMERNTEMNSLIISTKFFSRVFLFFFLIIKSLYRNFPITQIFLCFSVNENVGNPYSTSLCNEIVAKIIKNG